MASRPDTNLFDDVIGGAANLTFAFTRTLTTLVRWKRLDAGSSGGVSSPYVSPTTFFGICYLIFLLAIRVASEHHNGRLTPLQGVIGHLSWVTTTNVILATMPVLVMLLAFARLLALEVPVQEREGFAALVIYVAGVIFLAAGELFAGAALSPTDWPNNPLLRTIIENLLLFVVLGIPSALVIDVVVLIIKHLWPLWTFAPWWRRFAAGFWRAITILAAAFIMVAGCFVIASSLEPNQVSIRSLVNPRVAPNRIVLLIDNNSDATIALPRDSIWVYSRRSYEEQGGLRCAAPGGLRMEMRCFGERAHVVNWPNEQPFQFVMPGQSFVFDTESNVPPSSGLRIATVLFRFTHSSDSYYATTEWF